MATMNLTAQIAKHIRTVYFGGNWTSVNLKQVLDGVTWQQATTPVHSLNTIAVLVYHINYYADAIIQVLQGGPLDAHDAYSFDLPPLRSQEDWEALIEKLWANAETFASLVEQLPDSRLGELFADAKYGNWYRNLHGFIEHTHYHLGQIVLIKKMMLRTADTKPETNLA
jgi:hypothetical protein